MVSEVEQELMRGVIEALKPLSPVRRRIALGLAKGMSRKAIAEQVGFALPYGISTVVSAGNEPKVREVVNKIEQAALHGLTKDLLFHKHKQLIDAKKIINTATGTIEVPDNATQGKMLELAYKVLDVLKDESTMLVETHEQRMARLRGSDCD